APFAPSSEPDEIVTGRLRQSAISWHHSSELVPPPLRATLPAVGGRYSTQSRIASESPSYTARTRCSVSCSGVSPMNCARAVGSTNGPRSPELLKYGWYRSPLLPIGASAA